MVIPNQANKASMFLDIDIDDTYTHTKGLIIKIIEFRAEDECTYPRSSDKWQQVTLSRVVHQPLAIDN